MATVTSTPWTQNVVAAAVLAMVAFALWSMLYHAYPEGNRDLINIIIGVVVSKLGTVVDFFFGSSRSEQGPQAPQVPQLPQLPQVPQQPQLPPPPPAARE